MWRVYLQSALLGFSCVACVFGEDRLGAEWPQWRGPSGQGISTAKDLPLMWSQDTNVRWKVATPGRGHSSPIVKGNQIWLTTAMETLANPADAQERLKTNTGDQPLTLLDRVELKAICLDRETGQLLHNVSLITVERPQWVHKLNSFASPTPFLDGNQLFCHFGAYGSACVDTSTAKLVWVNTDLYVMHENGPGGSPMIVGDHLVFHMDGSDRQFIAALDKRTGKLAWRTERSGEMNANPQLKKSYGTPVLVERNGAAQIFSPATDWLYGYDPINGSELWKVPYGQLGFSLTPRPVLGNGMIYLATGFGKGQILAIKYEGVATPEVVWRFNRGTPTMPSPLLVGQELYFVSDTGVLTCLDALNGTEHYRERLGGNYSSSLWYADGRVYVSNREGDTHVFRAGKSFELLAKNSLGEAIMATPAAIDRAIYLRTESQLYRIE